MKKNISIYFLLAIFFSLSIFSASAFSITAPSTLHIKKATYDLDLNDLTLYGGDISNLCKIPDSYRFFRVSPPT